MPYRIAVPLKWQSICHDVCRQNRHVLKNDGDINWLAEGSPKKVILESPICRCESWLVAMLAPLSLLTNRRHQLSMHEACCHLAPGNNKLNISHVVTVCQRELAPYLQRDACSWIADNFAADIDAWPVSCRDLCRQHIHVCACATRLMCFLAIGHVLLRRYKVDEKFRRWKPIGPTTLRQISPKKDHEAEMAAPSWSSSLYLKPAKDLTGHTES